MKKSCNIIKKSVQITSLILTSFLIKVNELFAQAGIMGNVQGVYGIERTPQTNYIPAIEITMNVLIYIISPIVFIVGLNEYIFGKKRKDKRKIKRSKKIMLIGVIIATISIIVFIILLNIYALPY